MAAGIAKLTMAGISREKKSPNGTTPFCQTNSVVISPKGLNEPPALDATTTLIQDKATKRGLALPIAKITEPNQQSGSQVITAGGNKERLKTGNPE